MATDPEIPLGHSTPSHHVHGWCSHCPGRSVAEELAAWQVDAMSHALGRTDKMEQMRIKNERMRHELEVMYGGAFDSPPAPDRGAALNERERAMLGFALEMAGEEIHARSLEVSDEDQAALTSLRRLAGEAAAGAHHPSPRMRARRANRKEN